MGSRAYGLMVSQKMIVFTLQLTLHLLLAVFLIFLLFSSADASHLNN